MRSSLPYPCSRRRVGPPLTNQWSRGDRRAVDGAAVGDVQGVSTHRVTVAVHRNPTRVEDDAGGVGDSIAAECVLRGTERRLAEHVLRVIGRRGAAGNT